jgi:hypothetical protein
MDPGTVFAARLAPLSQAVRMEPEYHVFDAFLHLLFHSL